MGRLGTSQLGISQPYLATHVISSRSSGYGQETILLVVQWQVTKPRLGTP
jgi:hypothetical protein